MQSVENSAVSKSTASTTENKKQKLLFGKQSKIDAFFPLFQEMKNVVRIPNFITIIVSVYCFYQLLLVTTWVKNPFYTHTTDFALSTIPYFLQIFWFADTRNYTQTLNVNLAIVVIFSVFIFSWVFFQLYYYSLRRTFIKWTLYLTKIVFDVITPVIVMPASTFISISFLDLTQNGHQLSWVYLIVGIICIIMILSILIVNLKLNSRSIILGSTTFPIIESSGLISYILLSFITQFVSFVFDIFPEWLAFIPQLIHLVVSIYILTKSLNMHFYLFYGNVMFSGFLTAGIIMDVLMCAFWFVDSIETSITFFIAICLGLVCSLIYIPVYSLMTKRIVRTLTYERNDMTADEKNSLFDSLGLGTNTEKAIKYLYVGLYKMCDLFIDMSLTQYISKTAQTCNAYIALAQTTAFFPGETRMLNLLFKILVNRRDIGFSDRFMIFQIHRTKILRASSSSLETNELIIELKNLNLTCEAHIKGFWTMGHADLSFCESIGREWVSSLLLWKESQFTYPNNAKISYEFSRFLAETKLDLDGAIYQQQRGDFIEGGKNFAVDNCFKSFIRTFPKYVLDEVLDIKGNKVKRAAQVKGSASQSTRSSSSNSNTFGTTGTDFTIDAEMEDAIGKKILTNSKMRLALYHSINDWKTPYRKWQYITSLITLVATTAAFVVIYTEMVSVFQVPRTSINNNYNIGRIRFYEDLTILQLVVRWAKKVGKIGDFSAYLGDYKVTDAQFTTKLDFDRDLATQVMESSHLVANFLDTLCDDLSKRAEIIDVYSYASSMLNEESKFFVCQSNELMYSTPSTFKDVVAYMIYMNQYLAFKPPESLVTDNDYCALMTNSFNFFDDVAAIAAAFSSQAAVTADDIKDEFMLIIAIVPALLFVVTFFPILIVNIFFVRSVNKMLNSLLSLSPEAKERAKLPNRCDIEYENNASEAKDHCSIIYIFMAVFMVLSIIITLLCIFFILDIIDTNDLILDYHYWFVCASRRSAVTVEATIEFVMLNVLDSTVETSYENLTYNAHTLQTDADTIMDNHQWLTQGKDTLGPFVGYDDYIDSVTYSERCTINSSDSQQSSLHDLYRCASLSQQLSMWRDMASRAISDYSQFGGKLDSELGVNGLHIMTDHMWDTFTNLNARMVSNVEGIYDAMNARCIIFVVIAIAIAVLDVLFTLYFVTKVDLTYSVLISLIQQLKPTDIIASKDIMNFLLNKKDSDNDKSMGVSQTVIYNAADAIICTGHNGVVEIVNPSVSQILGYTPDQLLGQPITSFFKSADAETVQKQLELMANGQSGAVYEDHLKCISDASVEVSFATTIIGMKNEGHSDISSFVFILSDETQRIKQQIEADEAKAKSEKLLYQILPKDIVFKLNRGEKDITFTVPHASIIFIDIVKFSDYAAALSPQEIMGNLSIIFAAFDTQIAKYTKMTKIKLIGDVYMAAGGLFSGEEDTPNQHADEAVKFGLDCISELDDVNLKLSASLEVRVGVNTGGPIIAGVLGTDKPVFDIIGDPINIASRLQSTDIPGKVQISQATKELLDDSNLQIEERGEVFLKGKGKQMTYLVTPLTGFLQITGSMTLISSQGNTANI